MKAFIKIFTVLALLTIITANTSCSDELYLKNDVGSELSESGSFRVSRFKVKRAHWDIPRHQKEITLELTSHSDNSVQEFTAIVEHNENEVWVNMYIHHSKHIADSDYDLTATLQDGTRLGTKLTVTFRDEMLYEISGWRKIYNLKGKGTKNEPYEIATTSDFVNFQVGLSDDDTRGAGIFFKQTGDFLAPRAGDAINGRLYVPSRFAGVYDGFNHTITMQYSGSSSESDDSVGIFSKLITGASVRNLVVEATIRGGRKYCGAIAGFAQDSVYIDNVTVKGFIIGNSQVGGFIGGTKGYVKATNCYLAASVNGYEQVGGFTGSVDNGYLTINNFTNLLHTTAEEQAAGAEKVKMYDFAVIADASCAGGVVGKLSGGCNISNVVLQHTLDSEAPDIKVIHGTSNAGGIVGDASITTASSMSNNSSVAPVSSSSERAGGIIGNGNLSAELQLLSNTVGTYIHSNQYAGGFFGYLKSNNHLVIDKSSSGSDSFLGQVSGGYAAVKGSTCIGGVFGYLEGDFTTKAPIDVNINVSGTSCIGGIIGKQYNSTLPSRHFNINPNMTVSGDESIGGLVGHAEHATIAGYTLQGNSIDVEKHPAASSFSSDFPGKVDGSGGKYIGGIVGYAYDSYIYNVCASGRVDGSESVGGIVGYLENSTRGDFHDCVAKLTDITNTSGPNTGGMVGLLVYNHGSYHNLINYSKVTGCDYTGGIVGNVTLKMRCPNFEIKYMMNEGTISGTHQVGGCVAYIAYENVNDYFNNSNTVRHAGNFGDVTSTADGNVGGIVGHGNTAKFTIKNCANHGAISSKGDAKVGGIVGRCGHDAVGGLMKVSYNMEVAYCCNRGSISSSNTNSHIGGIIGYQEEGYWGDSQNWMTHDCYNAGEIPSDQGDDTGGLIGYIDYYGEIGQCLNFGKVSYGNGAVGTHPGGGIWYHNDIYILKDSGKDWCADTFSESEKGDKSTFSGFDFNSTWTIGDSRNNSFPSLRDCPFQYK